ncbi:tetratricopeptide repeat protein [Deinococcus sp. HMF7604]|uniref:tetratricopeptide repeat protein n=1 Tax=Deinococcus betulae TaxID=2873312 RepID=UPI001CCBB8BC|nr:tetratricopeptide repeat protein [Deinococcus betulae]MBZ9750941.1 tetratricopeptide repeat protein [Deinococcus betulae]
MNGGATTRSARGQPTDTERLDLDAQLAQADELLVVDPARAEAVARAAAAQAQRDRDQLRFGQAQVLLGATLFFQAQYEDAQKAFGRALDAARQQGDQALEARALNGIGNVISHLGDYAGALERFLDSSRLALAAGDEQGRVRVLNNIAAVWSELGENASALQAHQEVVEVAGQLGDSALQSSARVNLMVDYHALGDYEQALALAKDIRPNLQTRDLKQHLVVTQAYEGDSLLRLGQLDAARQTLLSALPLAEAIGEQVHLCMMLLSLGLTYLQQGQTLLALPHLERALQLAQEHKISGQERDALGALSEVHETLGDYPGRPERPAGSPHAGTPDSCRGRGPQDPVPDRAVSAGHPAARGRAGTSAHPEAA